MGKTCSKCGEEKPETNEYFPKHPRGKNGLNACCKVCRAEYTKLYRESNKETRAARCKIWHKNNVDREKIYRKACLLYTSDACLLYTSPSPRDRS